MTDNLKIRRAEDADAEAISAVMIRAMLELNARDYPIDSIDAMVAGADPAGVRQRLAARTVFVATWEGKVIGTAGLEETPEGAVLRSLYVQPDIARCGVGSCLLKTVEDLARSRGHAFLRIPASLTAVDFYRRHGYAPTGANRQTEHTTIEMGKKV